MDVTLFVEHQCNLRCDYCYTGEKATRPMSDAVLDSAIELALSDAPAKVTLSFFGGEPLLRFPFLKQAVGSLRRRAAERSRPPDVRVVVNSNATLVDDEVIAWLVAEGAIVNVSLDGPAALHDRHRTTASGRGSHGAVIAGIERLIAAGVPIQLTAVTTPATAPQMADALSELYRYPALQYVISPELSATWSDDDLEGLRRGAHAAAERWADEFRAGRVRLTEPFLAKVLSHALGGAGTPARCSMALREVTVAPSGYLYSCAQLVGEDRDPQHRIGHVDSGVDQAAVAALRERQRGILPICEPCDLRTRCGGDCGCRQVAASGRVGVIDGLLCDTEAAMVAATDAAIERLVAEACQPFIEFVYARRWALKPGAELVSLRRARSSAEPA